MTGPQASPELRFVGAAMMAVGGLIAALCGSCTLVITIAMIAQSLDSLGDVAQVFPIFLVVGGIPTLLGVLLFAWGRRLRRPPRSGRIGDLTLSSDEKDQAP
ncbi:MAG: hypothetical protein AB1942_12040 [Pseudomonadota bacterium]